MNNLQCWGGSLHGHIVPYQGAKFSPADAKSKHEYYFVVKGQGVYAYVERWWARMFYVYIAKQYGYTPEKYETFGEFRSRSKLIWKKPGTLFAPV